MKKLLIIVVYIFLLPSFANAEIVKKAFVCNDSGKMCFHWWPKMDSQKGWHKDEGASLHFRANMQILNGSDFSNSESVIYGKAVYKAWEPETKDLKEYVQNDIDSFKAKIPGLKVKVEGELTSKSGLIFRLYSFLPPKGKGNWERVAYSEESDKDGNEYYLVFTLSSKSEKGFKSSLNDYELYIESYE